MPNDEDARPVTAWTPPGAPPAPVHAPVPAPSAPVAPQQASSPAQHHPGFAGPYPPSGYPPGPYAQAPTFMQHKPGVMALRPLLLGDVFDATINTVRRNPGATLLLTALISSALALVPWLITLVISSVPSLFGLGSLTQEEAAGVSTAGLFIGLVTTALGTILITGLLAPVARAAAVGQKLTMGEAWRATYGSRWRILALTLVQSFALLVTVGLMIGLMILVIAAAGDVGFFVLIPGIPLTVAAAAYLYIKLCLALPALVLERVNLRTAIARSWTLTKGQFWRIFGILLLATLAIAIISQVFSIPGSLLSSIPAIVIDDETLALNLSLLILLVSTVLSQCVTVPFTAGVTVFLYLDQRMRKEGYDVVLYQEAEQLRQRAAQGS